MGLYVNDIKLVGEKQFQAKPLFHQPVEIEISGYNGSNAKRIRLIYNRCVSQIKETVISKVC